MRELGSGLGLGLILAILGFIRIMVWGDAYGEYYVYIALSVSVSLVGIVLWGTVTGSMLPFALKKVGLDPAAASAPFVATLVDVTGLAIYFSVAHFFLKGILL
jgi:magnesium transporter